MSAERRYRRAEELEGPQREAALAEGNAVVAAGAGSGKTTVLAARFVRLLETARMPSGERVRSRNVLVLTFTRKAAAEMYSRIYGSLSEAAALAAEGEDAELASHLALCLADFSRAQISTFDSFASRIARAASARFGVAPDFAVDEDRARESAGRLALSFILEHREEEALRDLVSALGLGGAKDDLLAELAVRRMSISSPPDFAAFHAAQALRLESMIASSREAILAMRAAALDYSGTKTTETSRRWLDALGRGIGEGEEGFGSFLEGLDGLRKPPSNSRDEASLFLSDAVPGLKKAAQDYRDIAATRAAHPGRLGLYRRLDAFRARWDATRRAEKTLTFRDVATLALDALKADEELRRHYQRLYRYVMIDEFQDDDELQKRILYLLAAGPDWESAPPRSLEPAERGSAPPSPEPQARDLAPGRLFFVGDEKQSIYLFRGADVSVFRGLAAELAASSPASSSLSLSRNFRSEAGIIDAINAVFPTVMAPRDPERGREGFEAAFEPLEARPPTPGVAPRVVYLELPRALSGGEAEAPGLREAAECEAWEVARIVRDAVEGGSLPVADRKAGRARPARYEDFALLLRSTGKQVHFEKYFRLFGVPYGAENACGLFSEAVACDLYYALRLAAHPGDRNALAAFLRSPFAGLSDEALVRVLLAGKELPWTEAAPILPEADAAGLERGAATFGALRAMADRAPIARCLSYLWFEAGYRAALLADPVAAAFEEHFELVHSLAVEADSRGRSLAAFAAGLEALVGQPDKLEAELPREGASGVRIMTIHKSKGLEFPVVIVPQANNVGQDRASREAWFWEEGIGPTFKPPAAAGSRSRNAFFERSRERREAMEAAELKRLLYVALTRAESHIIVTATEPRGEDARGRSFRSLLGSALGLFEPPSPLGAGPEDEARGGGGRSEPRLRLPPFGELIALPSGALVGKIPPRTDVEYYRLVAGSARGLGPKAPSSARPVERRASPASTSVTAIASRLEASSPPRAPEEELEVPRELAAPAGLSPEAWGSLVHAVLEAALAPAPSALELPVGLRAELDDALGGEAGTGAAVERASRLAGAFLGSELGKRALASPERYVEWKVALAYDSAPRGAPPLARVAKASVDLVFVDSGRAVVVDYKTDSSIGAGRHELQVAAYRRAAEEILGLPSEGWLFYLYGGGRAVSAGGEGAPSLGEAPEEPGRLAARFGPEEAR